MAWNPIFQGPSDSLKQTTATTMWTSFQVDALSLVAFDVGF